MRAYSNTSTPQGLDGAVRNLYQEMCNQAASTFKAMLAASPASEGMGEMVKAEIKSCDEAIKKHTDMAVRDKDNKGWHEFHCRKVQDYVLLREAMRALLDKGKP